MIKSDIDTRIDDERRKTGTTFIGTDEKTRYENLGLYDISAQIDFDEQETTQDHTFSIDSGNSSVNKLSAVCANLKDRKAIIAITALSSYTKYFSHIRPENLAYIYEGNFWAIDGNDLLIKYNGTTNDTLRIRYYTNFVAKTSGGTLSASMTASTDEPLMEVMDQESVIQFVLMKVFKKEGKKDDFREAKDRYEEIVKRIAETNESRRSYIYDRMTVEDRYNSDWTLRIGRA